MKSCIVYMREVVLYLKVDLYLNKGVTWLG